ncbi:MAG: diguanylate cyclase [Acidiferrobacterales bacterium]
MGLKLFNHAVPRLALSRPLVLAVLLIACVSSVPVHAVERAKNILFVFSWNQGIPWQRELEKGFEQQFSISGTKPNLYYEYMDAGRFSSPDQLVNFRKYLEEKYSGLPLDDVVFESEPAARLLQSKPGMFGKARLLALNPSPDAKIVSSIAAVVPVRIDFETSVQEILRMTGAKTVYLVGGTTSGTANRARVVTGIISRITPNRKVVSLVGLPMAQILNRLEKPEPDSIIFYLLMFRDGTGKPFIPFEAAREITARAHAPVYSFWTSLVGSGIVGGYMLSGEQVGREAAVLLSNGLKRGRQADLTDRFHGYYFDWRQLIHWGIDESALPRNSTIMFRRPEFFKEHLVEISITLILAVLVVLAVRYRELKKYNREVDSARKELQSANLELGRVKNSLEEKNEMLRKLSITDSLTGLHNRAYLDEKLREEFNRIERHPDNLSIILVDIDHFKRVNDRYGHQVGDEVLIRVADTLQKNIRSIDTIGRWGGEEFIIICPGSDEGHSVKLAEKLRKILGDLKHEGVGQVTCSFGVASHGPLMTQAKLIRNADEALYHSKAAGRNRVSSIAPESYAVSR